MDIMKQISRTQVSVQAAFQAIKDVFCMLVNETYALSVAAMLLPFGLRGGIRKVEGSKCPILLVHGYGHNLSGWRPIMKRLEKEGFGPIYAMNLSAPMSGSIDDHAQEVADVVQQIQGETGRKDITLIGHSMGGLVTSYYTEHLADDQEAEVKGVITLGSPLRGTPLAYVAPGTCAREMEPQSPLLRNVKHKVKRNEKTIYVHHASSWDIIVFPQQTAIIRDERTYLYRKVGHLFFLFCKKVHNRIVDELREMGALS